MNRLVLVVPSDLKMQENFTRIAESIDVFEDITVYFINQSEEKSLNDVYEFKKSECNEIRTYKTVPLSTARNIALKKIYKECRFENNTLIMFVDDDAWFPRETLEYLLISDVKAYSLKTIDPAVDKSFSLSHKTQGIVKGWHLVHDIVSICLVVPLMFLKENGMFFNEKLGLGNRISQGEESLFIYEMSKKGVKISYDYHLVYHSYKRSFNIKNFYSMSYFWWVCLTHVSVIFLWPAVKHLLKYTLAIVLSIRDKRYLEIFKAVWEGCLNGVRDTEEVIVDK